MLPELLRLGGRRHGSQGKTGSLARRRRKEPKLGRSENILQTGSGG